MAVVLLNLVFFILTTLSNLITRIIFTATAHVLVQLIQALKVPGEGSQRILEQVRDVIKACLEYLIKLVIGAISTVITSLFDLVKEGILNTSSGLTAAVTGLIEQLRTSLNETEESLTQVLNAFAEMIGKIVTDLWNNYKDAVGYVTENAVN